MKSIKSQIAIALIGIIVVVFSSCKQDELPPNIIFIMSDDHASTAISAYGKSLVETPNIDKLANQGMMFNNCFDVDAICGPSRAAILSGRYGAHTGYMRNGDPFDRNLLTFPKLLQQAGYQTAIIGKWHLGTQPSGFDYYNVIPFHGQYFDSRMKETGKEWQDGAKGGIVQPGYLTDVITDKAIDWLKKRDTKKPFCLIIHHKAPHGPYEYPERYNDILANETIPEPVNFDDTYEGKNRELIENDCEFSKLITINPFHLNEEIPDTIKIGTVAYKKWSFQSVIKGYHRLVSSLDENIGQLMDFVDDSGLKKNTIVIYTSDNGWFLGEHGLFNKMWMYEEALRVPLIVRYPKSIKPKTVNNDLVSVLDFAPTLLDYAGIEKPKVFQGQSLRKTFEGNMPNDEKRTVHFYHYFGQFGVPSHYGIRTRDFKLIFFYEAKEEPKFELYDIKNDPKEMVNLVNDPKYAIILKNLKNLLEEKQIESEK